MNFSQFKSEQTLYFTHDVNIPKDFYPDYPYILRATLYRSKKLNSNTFLLIVGSPRTSKSYCAMKFAELYCKGIGKEFDVDKQLTFDDIKKFLIWSQDVTDDIFILDETGTSLSPDVWYTLASRIMRKFIQTQGFRRNVLVWVLPSVIFLQKKFSFMSNYAIKTIRQGLVSQHKILFDQLSAKGRPDWIGENWKFTLPKSETIEKYEQMKKEWNDLKLKEDINWLEELERPYEKRKFNATFYIDAFKNCVIDDDELREKLLSLNYNQEDIELAIKNEINKF
jgi:hypothetical protein